MLSLCVYCFGSNSCEFLESACYAICQNPCLALLGHTSCSHNVDDLWITVGSEELISSPLKLNHLILHGNIDDIWFTTRHYVILWSRIILGQCGVMSLLQVRLAYAEPMEIARMWIQCGNTCTRNSFWTWHFWCFCSFFPWFLCNVSLAKLALWRLAIAREELQKTILQLRDFDLLIQVVHLAWKSHLMATSNWQGLSRLPCHRYEIGTSSRSGSAHGSSGFMTFNSVGWRRASGLAVCHLASIQSTLRSTVATLTQMLANICKHILKPVPWQTAVSTNINGIWDPGHSSRHLCPRVETWLLLTLRRWATTAAASLQVCWLQVLFGRYHISETAFSQLAINSRLVTNTMFDHVMSLDLWHHIIISHCHLNHIQYHI